MALKKLYRIYSSYRRASFDSVAVGWIKKHDGSKGLSGYHQDYGQRL